MSFEPKATIYANNKTSAKLSWKRKEAITIAQSIHRWFEEKGFYLPASHRTIFGRSFKTTETTNWQVAYRLKEQHNLAQDPAHLQAYALHIQKVQREGNKCIYPQGLLEMSIERWTEWNNRPIAKKARLSSPLPLSFKHFTDKRYAELKKEMVKQLRTEHDQASAGRALQFFTDRDSGECYYDEYVELARAYYTLRQSAPAVYALFKHPTNNHYLKQLVAMSCSTHRLDPVWNYKKSKLIRGLWYRFLQKTRVHEHFQPMHLMLTVPHKDGVWQGKKFYAREFIEKFNLMRKYPEWNKYMHGGEYGIEVTRKGASGLHIHMHCLVFQRHQFSRDEVNEWIRAKWNDLTGADVTWYETLYVHRKDASGKYIMEEGADGIPVLDKTGLWTDENNNYTFEENGPNGKIRGKRKKFYLDKSEPWFNALTPDEQLKHYCDGVMECIKYHFKTDCFKDKNGQWDVDLMKDVLQYSRKLRMYSKFGAFYREKSLNYTKLEKPPVIPNDVTAAVAEGVEPDSDGVAGRVINPYTNQLAEFGHGYSRVLAVPELQRHGRDRHGQIRAPVDNENHDTYYKLQYNVSITDAIAAIMRGTDEGYQKILIQDDFERYKRDGWKSKRQAQVWV